MTRGRFITLEGGEGVGKSTQARLLAARLEDAGIDVVRTREPGGTPGAEEIRGLLVSGSPGRWDPMAETLLHMAARAEHVEKVIRPALAAGRWVICDRFVDSTRVYQGMLQGIGDERVMALHEIALGGLMPDLTLILDLTSDLGLARARARAEPDSRYERMADDFHRRLAEGFRRLGAEESARCRLIDADGDEEAVAARLWQAVEPLLPAAGRRS